MADMNLLNQILAEILTCACDVLDNGLADAGAGSCGCPCRAFVTVGAPVPDIEACCGDGQLAVWVRDIYPFSNFPARGNSAEICSPSLAANVTVQLLRCWPSMKEDGSAPTGPEIQRASDDIYRDLYLLTWGLICCLLQNGRKRKFALTSSRITGPQGGCVGAEVEFAIELLAVS